MKKLILSIFAVVLFAVTLSAQEPGTSRDFWRKPVQVQTNNIRPIPTAANQILVSDTTSSGAIRYVGKDFATAAAEAGVGGGEAPTFFTSTDTTYMVYAGDTSVVTTKGYREYVATINQSGTSAPTAVVRSNTLGWTPTFTYIDAGEYKVNLGETYSSDMVVLMDFSRLPLNQHVIWFDEGSETYFYISTIAITTPTDNLLNPEPLEFTIRIYD